MILTNIFLEHFRSSNKNSFLFSPQSTLVIGPNTAGKTNLLEAIYLLATGKSFRADIEKEMISYEQEIARVRATVSEVAGHESSDDESLRSATRLEIMLTTGQVSGQAAPYKKYLINGVSKRMVDFIGNLPAVLFWPEDLDLVTNSPSRRRKYLDLVLCQVDREYRRSLMSYEKGLRQRNKLLERIRDEGSNPVQLAFWDKLLIRNGSFLTDKRQDFIEFVNNFHLSFPLIGGVNLHFHLEYDKSVISEARLQQYAQEEVAAGATLVGPHRDDFLIRIFPHKYPNETLPDRQAGESGRDVSIYGSRGEQRLAILWLKLAELEFITQKTGTRPILLLDDIFSELDHQHRQYVFKVIPQQQTIITTTDLHLIDKDYLKEVKVIELK
ncbi:MAG: DNA replication and repair protein RecF [Candidatus Gottesmanbacteria bacterium]